MLPVLNPTIILFTNCSFPGNCFFSMLFHSGPSMVSPAFNVEPEELSLTEEAEWRKARSRVLKNSLIPISRRKKLRLGIEPTQHRLTCPSNFCAHLCTYMCVFLPRVTSKQVVESSKTPQQHVREPQFESRNGWLQSQSSAVTLVSPVIPDQAEEFCSWVMRNLNFSTVAKTVGTWLSGRVLA